MFSSWFICCFHVELLKVFISWIVQLYQMCNHIHFPLLPGLYFCLLGSVLQCQKSVFLSLRPIYLYFIIVIWFLLLFIYLLLNPDSRRWTTWLLMGFFYLHVFFPSVCIFQSKIATKEERDDTEAEGLQGQTEYVRTGQDFQPFSFFLSGF